MGELDDAWYAQQKEKERAAIANAERLKPPGFEKLIESTLVLLIWMAVVIGLPAYVILHFVLKYW